MQFIHAACVDSWRGAGRLFRQSTRRQSAELTGVTGWVRNCTDGAVRGSVRGRGCRSCPCGVLKVCIMARPPQWSARLTWQVGRIRANLASVQDQRLVDFQF
ncbi:acylphosphatase [Candidatus Amarolinea dominans]|uniref:acylphosphatase n=1 Tax=Candidatus Amarolinea dominans TaxID=3140696 RepID=UPI0031CC61F1